MLGWRPVPTDLSKIGKSAAAVAPVFEQLFVCSADTGARTRGPVFERQLYIARKRIEHEVETLSRAPHHRRRRHST